MFDLKYDFHHQNTHTSCVYFDITFPGITPVYPNVILILKIGHGYVPLNIDDYLYITTTDYDHTVIQVCDYAIIYPHRVVLVPY